MTITNDEKEQVIQLFLSSDRSKQVAEQLIKQLGDISTWLFEPHPALEGKTPAEVLQEGEGSYKKILDAALADVWATY